MAVDRSASVSASPSGGFAAMVKPRAPTTDHAHTTERTCLECFRLPRYLHVDLVPALRPLLQPGAKDSVPGTICMIVDPDAVGQDS